MKTDPNACCVIHREHRLWAMVHDGLAHPLMAVTGYCRWAKRFHDFTSMRAWPRNRPKPVIDREQGEDETW